MKSIVDKFTEAMKLPHVAALLEAHHIKNIFCFDGVIDLSFYGRDHNDDRIPEITKQTDIKGQALVKKAGDTCLMVLFDMNYDQLRCVHFLFPAASYNPGFAEQKDVEAHLSMRGCSFSSVSLLSGIPLESAGRFGGKTYDSVSRMLYDIDLTEAEMPFDSHSLTWEWDEKTKEFIAHYPDGESGEEYYPNYETVGMSYHRQSDECYWTGSRGAGYHPNPFRAIQALEAELAHQSLIHAEKFEPVFS